MANNVRKPPRPSPLACLRLPSSRDYRAALSPQQTLAADWQRAPESL